MINMSISVKMTDGTTHRDLTPTLKDMVRTEEIGGRLKWGSMNDSPVRYAAFMAYAVMTRTGLYDATKGFDDFQDDCETIIPDEEFEVNPTL